MYNVVQAVIIQGYTCMFCKWNGSIDRFDALLTTISLQGRCANNGKSLILSNQEGKNTMVKHKIDPF